MLFVVQSKRSHHFMICLSRSTHKCPQLTNIKSYKLQSTKVRMQCRNVFLNRTFWRFNLLTFISYFWDTVASSSAKSTACSTRGGPDISTTSRSAFCSSRVLRSSWEWKSFTCQKGDCFSVEVEYHQGLERFVFTPRRDWSRKLFLLLNISG